MGLSLGIEWGGIEGKWRACERRSESKEGEGVSWVGTKRFHVVFEAKQSASMLRNEPLC